MTLITTEIHNPSDPAKALIVFAADRRISKSGRYYDTRKKIFQLPWLHAGVGYFGLAETAPGQPIQDWLKHFNGRATVNSPTLEAYAKNLTQELNGVVPVYWRRGQVSGFHISGFSAGKPEFWYVRNIDDQGHPTGRGYEFREDFQRRDIGKLNPGQAQIYRNGDLRAHEAAWGKIDNSLGLLLLTPGFRQLRTPEDYVKWVKFKMEVIAYFYKGFYKKSIIARPIDAFFIRPRL